MAFALMLVLLLSALAFLGNKPVEAAPPTDQAGDESGDGVTPDLIPNNPSCEDLGYDYGFKPSPETAPNGVYTNGTLTVTTTNNDGTYFDWTSNLGLDAVIVKGGDNADAFVYDPPQESTSDTRLHAPFKADGTPRNISHIEFCYDLELEVEKTATTSFTRTNNWTIDKSVSPDTLDLFTGDSGISEYTVSVDKGTPTDSDFAVNGTIQVYNPAPFAASGVDVQDVISGFSGNVNVDCGVTLPTTLPSKGTLNCTYEAALTDGSDRTNTATATTTTDKLGDGSGTADVNFGDPTNEVNKTVSVDDSVEGPLGTFSDDGSKEYEKTFSCDGDEGTHNNTASLIGDGGANLGSDSASVTVNCYALSVSKDAQTSFTRTWNWTIDKSADQSELTLSPGQEFLVNYSILVNASATDSARNVTGNITVSNPAPVDATINNVSDVISGFSGTVDVECAGVNSFPTTLPAGETLNCEYAAENLPDGSPRTNTATATLQNYSYSSSGTATATGTTDFSGSAAVTFGSTPTVETDEEINLSDTYIGGLQPNPVSVKASEVPKTFNYSRTVGPYDTPGDRTVENTACLVTNDTSAERCDSVTIIVHVPADGCTLTIGYWKTHADPTSNRTNPNATGELLAELGSVWLGQPGGTGKFNLEVKDTTTAVKVLNKWDESSNGIYKLQAQLFAAKLNIANGADGSAVAGTIQQADSFLATNNKLWGDLSKAKKNQVLSWATTLDKYNNGLIGPGHCNQERTV